MDDTYNEYGICSYNRWSATEYLRYTHKDAGTAVVARNMKGFDCNIKILAKDDTKALRDTIRTNDNNDWQDFEPEGYEDSGANTEIDLSDVFDEVIKAKVEAMMATHNEYILTDYWEIEDYFRDTLGWDEDSETEIDGPVMIMKKTDGTWLEYND